MTRSALFPALFASLPMLLAGEPLSAAAPLPRYLPPQAPQDTRLCFHSWLEWPTRDFMATDGLNAQVAPYLTALGEPALFSAKSAARAPGAGALRFIFLTSRYENIVVRIVWARNRPVRLTGAVLWDDGEGLAIKHRVDRALTRADIARLREAVTRTRALDAPGVNCRHGMDGQTWLFESVSDAGYRLLERWSPEPGPHRELGRTLVRLSGLPHREID
ncbi:hypothetical protein ACSBM8_18600 [Sphingomonas sp. ASY06-1R]|uniref:hypothetical protein n=1 Tax=Sphingomonas sp. ASY06-1R TaxID=3445771 RepID=UPI003FA257EE